VSIGDKVRATRKAAGISQEEVARRAGVSLNVINRLERGVILDPHYSTLRGIASALGVPVEDLVREPALAGKAEAPKEAGRTHIDQSAERLKSSGSKLPEVADLLLDLGQMLLLTWEAELPQRAAQDDDEWLANIVTMWRAFGLANYGVLDELGAERLRNQQGWLARYMDVNATIYRINAAIRKHSDTSEEAPMMLEPLGVA
jgi:transcriptional regulator with XRE-family HTH domain